MLVELLLVADVGVERDLDLAAVKVAVEVEQMRLEQLLRRLEGRADAEAGDAGMLAAVVERHAHRIDAVARAADSRRARGWRSDSRARARARRRAGPRPRSRSRGSAAASRCRCRRRPAPRGSGPRRCARRRAAPARPLRRRCRASAPSVFSSRDIAAAALAEGEVVAGDDARRADLLAEHVGDEFLGAGRRAAPRRTRTPASRRRRHGRTAASRWSSVVRRNGGTSGLK